MCVGPSQNKCVLMVIGISVSYWYIWQQRKHLITLVKLLFNFLAQSVSAHVWNCVAASLFYLFKPRVWKSLWWLCYNGTLQHFLSQGNWSSFVQHISNLCWHFRVPWKQCRSIIFYFLKNYPLILQTWVIQSVFAHVLWPGPWTTCYTVNATTSLLCILKS